MDEELITQDSLITRANIAIAQGDFASAITFLKTALAINPDSPKESIILESLYLLMKENSLAGGEINELSKLKKCPAYDSSFCGEPFKYTVNPLKGSEHEMNLFERLNKANRLVLEDPEEDEEENKQAHGFMMKACALMEMKEWSNALCALQQALEVGYDQKACYFKMAQCAIELKLPKKAHSYADLAGSQLLHAKAFEKEGKYQECINAFEEAVENMEKGAREERGAFYFEMGYLKDAAHDIPSLLTRIGYLIKLKLPDKLSGDPLSSTLVSSIFKTLHVPINNVPLNFFLTPILIEHWVRGETDQIIPPTLTEPLYSEGFEFNKVGCSKGKPIVIEFLQKAERVSNCLHLEYNNRHLTALSLAFLDLLQQFQTSIGWDQAAQVVANWYRCDDPEIPIFLRSGINDVPCIFPLYGTSTERKRALVVLKSLLTRNASPLIRSSFENIQTAEGILKITRSPVRMILSDHNQTIHLTKGEFYIEMPSCSDLKCSELDGLCTAWARMRLQRKSSLLTDHLVFLYEWMVLSPLTTYSAEIGLLIFSAHLTFALKKCLSGKFPSPSMVQLEALLAPNFTAFATWAKAQFEMDLEGLDVGSLPLASELFPDYLTRMGILLEASSPE